MVLNRVTATPFGDSRFLRVGGAAVSAAKGLCAAGGADVGVEKLERQRGGLGGGERRATL